MTVILHVIDTLDPAAGGPQTVVTRLAAAQAALDHKVHILSHDDPEAAARAARASANIPGFGRVQCHLVPRGGRWSRLRAAGVRQELRTHLPRVDVVHMHGVWEPLILATAGLARQQGVPYCICPHGMLHPWSLQQKRLKKALALRLGYKAMLDRAAFLHVLNTDESDLISEFGFIAPRVVLPNGIFTEEIDPLPPRGKFRLRHPGLKSDPFILFLGRLHQKKGLDHLIQAFARLIAVHPDVQLVVAGPDGGERSSVEAAIGLIGCQNRVHIVGALYGEEKRAAYADASCFCLPSRQEGFSMAILEAMACGVPVVISEECCFPEVAAYAAGHVVTLSAEAVCNALLHIVSSPDEARAMGANGRALVLDRYLWSEIALRTIKAYGPLGKPMRVRLRESRDVSGGFSR